MYWGGGRQEWRACESGVWAWAEESDAGRRDEDYWGGGEFGASELLFEAEVGDLAWLGVWERGRGVVM